MLPGLDGTGKLFDAFIANLSQDLNPIVCVYPEIPAMGYSELFEVALRCIPKNKPYIILGESFSGPIAIDIGASRPTMLRGVVLVNSFVMCPRPHLVKLIRKLPNRILCNPPQAVLSILLKRCELGIEPANAISAVLRDLPEDMVRSRLALVEAVDVRRDATNVEVPVCVLQSVDDLAIPNSARKMLLESVRCEESYQLPGNHFGLQTHPRVAAEIVSEFRQQLGTLTDNEV